VENPGVIRARPKVDAKKVQINKLPGGILIAFGSFSTGFGSDKRRQVPTLVTAPPFQ
jgi:hypothetical protein